MNAKSTANRDSTLDHEVNPCYGEKREFRKITATLSQSAYESLIRESARRKIAGEPNQSLSALLREAIADYVKKLPAA